MKQIVNPIVGKFYNVPCAKIKNNDETIEYIPIVGIEHADPNFAGPQKHYHIDGRFASKTVDENGKTNMVVWTTGYDYLYKVVGIETRRRKCKRVTTGIIPPNGLNDYSIWRGTMIGKSCKGRRCPHYGTAMNEIDGKLVCPLHNLVGDIEREIIIE